MEEQIAKFSDKFRALHVRFANRSARAQIRAVGAGFTIEPPIYVKGGQNITIGESFRAMPGLHCFANDGILEIGESCSLNTNVYLGASNGSIVIGSRVMIGPNVVLRASDHGIVAGTPVAFQPHRRGCIVVEDDVWIGANCVITRNVRVAHGSIIGAGSVVTRDVPSGVVVGGVPARIIKERKDFPQYG